MSSRLEIKKGDKFKSLTIIKELPLHVRPDGQTNRQFLVMCECGEKQKLSLTSIRRRKTNVCKHNETQSKLYRVWAGMNWRCSKPANKKRYYQRGIRVCDSWKVYYNFKKWALANGYKEYLTIDRRDNNCNYEPSNCRWVPISINALNKEKTVNINYHGKEYSLMRLLIIKQLYYHQDAIAMRIKRGWSIEEAIDTPIRKGNYTKNHSIKKYMIKKQTQFINELKVYENT